jgi:short-subunit dehydrogenase
LAIATALAGGGARVVIGDLDADLAVARAAEFGGEGLPLDVSDEASFTEFLARAGELDVLVNNAGVAVAGTFLGTTASQHLLQIQVNLLGVERGMRLALPGMVARGRGQVVNIASAAGRIPAPLAATYTATKHAVVGLTDAVRTELRGTGVHLTVVLPTFVRTDMASGLRLRGFQQVGPEVVARAVARAVGARRPPASVMVPRWLRVLALADAASPQWLRDAVRGSVSLGEDTLGERAAYEARVARQLTDRSG